MENTRTCKIGLLVTFSLAIAMALAMSVCTARAWAATWTTDDFSYYETTVTGLTEAGKARLRTDQNLVIPDKGPDGADVTAIGNGEHDKGTFFAEVAGGAVVPTSVKLPAKLESIGSYAFAGLPVDQAAGEYAGLSSVDIPASVTSIGNFAFLNAPLEGELALPEGLTSMGNSAFHNRQNAPKKITKVNIPAGLKDIPEGAFSEQAIEDVSIPEGVEHIGGGAFSDNSSKTVSLPSTLVSISSGAFAGNRFAEVVIPGSVRSIWSSAFDNGSQSEKTLAKLTLNEGLINIESGAFGGSALESVDLPTTVTTLHVNAFKGGSKGTVRLVSTKYDQIKGEGDYAEVVGAGSGHAVVGDLARATIAAIPDQELLTGPVEPELDVTFDGHKLEAGTDYEVTYENNDKVGDATAWARGVEGGPFIGEKSAGFKVVAPSWKATDFTYADDGAEVTGLTGYGKQKLRALPDLVLPDRSPGGAYVTAIGPADDFDKGTFFADAPGGTAVPTSVVLPAKLESIGSFAFVGLPVDKSAGEYAGLSSVDFPATVTSIDTGAFRNAPLEGELALPEGLTSLGSCAFYTDNRASKKITGVVIPAGLEEIPAGAFLSQAIEDVSIPEGVKVVGDSAFGGNSSKTLSLPSTLTRIGGSAFGNHQFSEVEIPGSVEAVGSSAFHCSGTDEEKTLAKLTLNEGLASIGEGAFAGSGLESVALPTTVTELHEGAFDNGKYTVMLLSAKYDQVKGEGAYADVAAAGSGHDVVGDLSAAEISDIPDQEYAGGAPVVPDPEPTVTFDGKTLAKGADYEIEYIDNTEPGTAQATVSGTYGAQGSPGRFVNGVGRSFTIKGVDKSKLDDAIAAAKATEKGVRVSADGRNVNSTERYTTAAERQALDDAIAAARAVAGKGAATQAEVDRATADLAAAKDAYDAAKKRGKRVVAPKVNPNSPRFSPIQLRSLSQTDGSITLTWAKPAGAKSCTIYAAPCSPALKATKLATTAAGTLKVTKVAGKKLVPGKYYRFQAVAYDGAGNVVSTSRVAHVATKGGRYTNAAKVTTAAKGGGVELAAGKTFALGAKQVAANKKLALAVHRKVAYESSNANIAAVSNTGTIKAKAEGTCTVYAYSQSGTFAKVKVTVSAPDNSGTGKLTAANI